MKRQAEKPVSAVSQTAAKIISTRRTQLDLQPNFFNDIFYPDRKIQLEENYGQSERV